MNNYNNKKIINIALILIIVVIFGLFIFFIGKFKNNEKDGLSEEILVFLNETYKNDSVSSKSVIYGLLNFNFNSLESISTDSLIYSNMMSNSIMNETGIDSIYMGEFNISKNDYFSSNRYVDNPNMNCYYYQNNLNKKSFNCDSVCSKDLSFIMNDMMDKLDFINVLPEDAKTYCIKNALYPIELNGYFVNLTDMKNLYKEITNIDLVFDKDISSNKYYKYDAYLENKLLRLDDNINYISEINSLDKKNNNYVVSYKATTDSGKVLNGILTLGKNEYNYYLISNEIDSGFDL